MISFYVLFLLQKRLSRYLFLFLFCSFFFFFFTYRHQLCYYQAWIDFSFFSFSFFSFFLWIFLIFFVFTSVEEINSAVMKLESKLDSLPSVTEFQVMQDNTVWGLGWRWRWRWWWGCQTSIQKIKIKSTLISDECRLPAVRRSPPPPPNASWVLGNCRIVSIETWLIRACLLLWVLGQCCWKDTLTAILTDIELYRYYNSISLISVMLCTVSVRYNLILILISQYLLTINHCSRKASMWPTRRSIAPFRVSWLKWKTWNRDWCGGGGGI